MTSTPIIAGIPLRSAADLEQFTSDAIYATLCRLTSDFNAAIAKIDEAKFLAKNLGDIVAELAKTIEAQNARCDADTARIAALEARVSAAEVRQARPPLRVRIHPARQDSRGECRIM